MSLRDLFVFSVVALSIPIGFRVPFAGLMTFSWLAYMRAQDLCWGFARTMRFSSGRITTPPSAKPRRATASSIELKDNPDRRLVYLTKTSGKHEANRRQGLPRAA